MMRLEKSDGFVVPKDSRKREAPSHGIGKGTTVNKQTRQLDLLGDQPPVHGSHGVDAEGYRARPLCSSPVPLSSNAHSSVLSAMTMEEFASEMNLRRAFAHVARNNGAAGVDRQSVNEVGNVLDDVMSTLHRTRLDGTYRVGMVWRVWIPKSGGGERGLRIPNVVDRVVQPAVHQVLSPHLRVDVSRRQPRFSTRPQLPFGDRTSPQVFGGRRRVRRGPRLGEVLRSSEP